MPEARVNNVTNGNILTVSWPPAINTNFLDSYIVSYTTFLPGSSARRRRQTSSRRSVQVTSDQTSTQLMFTAYTDYMVDVDALYTPPNANNVTVSLLPTTTFRSPERRMKLL